MLAMRRHGTWTTPTLAGLAAVATAQLVLGLRRLRRSPVPAGLAPRQRLEAIFSAFVPEPLARFAAAEAALILYAVHWKAPPDIPAGATPIFYHRGARPMLWVLAGAGLMELVVLHVIALAFWGPKLAWPLFALSEIGLVYVLGLISSLDKLPILVFADRIEVRAGLLVTHVIRGDAIRAIRPSPEVRPADRDVLRASLGAQPTVAIELNAPIRVRSLKRGRVVEIRTIGVCPDDLDHFLGATAHLTATPSA
jgi:hypothetical protein